MEHVQAFLIYSLYFLSPLLIILILLQGGAGDVSSSFGGGGQLDSALGVGANRKMAKLTAVLVIIFMVAVLIAAIPRDDSLGITPVTDEPKVEATGDGVPPPPAERRVAVGRWRRRLPAPKRSSVPASPVAAT